MSSKQQAKNKKSILLRLDGDMWNEIALWADDEFRSINGQIEYILNEAIKRRKRGGKSG